jgi:hypothetical protein
MMKASILALTSFIGMVGVTNAVSLTSQADESYQPTTIVKLELSNLFNEFADEKDNTRMSFKAFATMLDNFDIKPENKDCSGEDDSDFYKNWMGDGCSGKSVNFKRPNIVRCDGMVIYCADAGKLRHFNAHKADSTGLDSLSFYQFK